MTQNEQAKPLQPRQLALNGRTIVNRDWILQRTGAGRSTAAKWYADRLQQPEEFRHPETSATIDRIKYYDKEQFETFFAWKEEQKKASLLPVDEELWTGDPDEWISINVATAWFHFADTGVIRKYVADFPGYFADPVGTVEGPSGRPIMAFRLGDLQDFARKRGGKGSGPIGRKPGPQPARGHRAQAAARIATAAAYLQEIGGYRVGVAAELAAKHDESARTWERAVKEARAQLGGTDT
ncbi:hypothetical protein [Streptomyces sp. NEAU-S7GS2]|uniref:hypothetical protein n=1 Tax=Streptomyces sp. NEAU-S7GS2 TaxID=2202000 RepID=UPI000D6FD499|nr:hypothetical protein [Streptomyces sp. NEAU-S7GS2]AWN24780.1 hypothetical protein DKG71_00040 [Streptomyces sp. NEAU-S7GS2]